jgi:putative aldouronate transport system permease protein
VAGRSGSVRADSPVALTSAGRGRLAQIVHDFPRQKSLYLMTAVGVGMIVVFQYIPIYGMQVAFKRFNVVEGIWGSPWIGLDNFKAFLTGPYAVRLIRNTMLLGFLSIVWGFWPPVVLALLLNELRLPTYKRVVQTVSYLPHFIATVVIVGMLKEFFSYDGIVNRVVANIGGETTNFFMEPGWFRPLYIGSAVWQGVGIGSILYLAVLANINPELYENAASEGANRWQLAWHITLPALLPTMMILLILSTTGIVNVGFEKVFLMQNPGIYETADVIQTYVYRVGLAGGQIGYGSAVGLLNTVVSLLFMVAVNNLGRKFAGHSLW